jgi:hypothetical protein
VVADNEGVCSFLLCYEVEQTLSRIFFLKDHVAFRIMDAKLY